MNRSTQRHDHEASRLAIGRRLQPAVSLRYGTSGLCGRKPNNPQRSRSTSRHTCRQASGQRSRSPRPAPSCVSWHSPGGSSHRARCPTIPPSWPPWSGSQRSNGRASPGWRRPSPWAPTAGSTSGKPPRCTPAWPPRLSEPLGPPQSGPKPRGQGGLRTRLMQMHPMQMHCKCIRGTMHLHQLRPLCALSALRSSALLLNLNQCALWALRAQK